MLISTLKHPDVRRILRLRRREERERTGLLFAEGVRFLVQAADNGAPFDTLVVARRMLASPVGQMVARRLRQAGVPCLEVTPEVFAALSLADAPQGVGAVLRQEWTPLAEARPAAGLCWIALEEVHSPGNLGTILRTSAAVGGAGVLLVGGAVDPYDPSVVRATMGAIFTQRLVRAEPAAFSAWKRRHGVTVVGASPDARQDYRAARYRSPLVLAMGCERRGLSEPMEALCDVTVRIPMAGAVDSLNLAVATGVMLYEVHRRSALGRTPVGSGPGG